MFYSISELSINSIANVGALLSTKMFSQNHRKKALECNHNVVAPMLIYWPVFNTFSRLIYFVWGIFCTSWCLTFIAKFQLIKKVLWLQSWNPATLYLHAKFFKKNKKEKSGKKDFIYFVYFVFCLLSIGIFMKAQERNVLIVEIYKFLFYNKMNKPPLSL